MSIRHLHDVTNSLHHNPQFVYFPKGCEQTLKNFCEILQNMGKTPQPKGLKTAKKVVKSAKIAKVVKDKSKARYSG